jgi:hypothetical protein
MFNFLASPFMPRQKQGSEETKLFLFLFSSFFGWFFGASHRFLF